jgi:hypothetical protein
MCCSRMTSRRDSPTLDLTKSKVRLERVYGCATLRTDMAVNTLAQRSITRCPSRHCPAGRRLRSSTACRTTRRFFLFLVPAIFVSKPPTICVCFFFHSRSLAVRRVQLCDAVLAACHSRRYFFDVLFVHKITFAKFNVLFFCQQLAFLFLTVDAFKTISLHEVLQGTTASTLVIPEDTPEEFVALLRKCWSERVGTVL